MSVERPDWSLPRPDDFLWYPSETAQFYPYQVCVQTAWPSFWTVFTKILSSFERKYGVIWLTGYRLNVLPSHLDGLQRLDIIRKCCLVVRTDFRNFPNSVDFWEQTPCWILIDQASGRCCSDFRTSSMFISKTLRASRRLQRPVWAVAQEPADLSWFFAMDTSWVSSRSLWTVNISMYKDSNLETDCQISEDWKNRLSCNHYIKCFCCN